MDNMFYNIEKNDIDKPIDMEFKNQSMESIQRKKEILEQMKQEIELAKQVDKKFHQEMRDEFMNRSIDNINEYEVKENSSRTK